MSDDFFDDVVIRDRWGRPLILGPDGQTRPYTRASSVANYVENQDALHTWFVRRVVKGLAAREDVMGMVAAVRPFTSDREADAHTTDVVDAAIETGADWGGCPAKANYGTAVHSFCSPGAPRDTVPKRMQADVASFDKAMKDEGIVQLASEVFVVDHDRLIAGTFDGVYDVPGLGVVVGDIKTGRHKPVSVACQLACYADSVVHSTGQTLHVTYGVRSDVGLHFQITAGAGETLFREVDLNVGRDIRSAALGVREARKLASSSWQAGGGYGEAARRRALEIIPHITTRVEAQALFEVYAAVWNSELREATRAALAAAEKPAG